MAIADARNGGADVCHVPYYVEACPQIVDVSLAGESGEVEASLCATPRPRKRSGMAHITIHYQIAFGPTLAINRGDMAAAEARFAPLAPVIEDEEC